MLCPATALALEIIDYAPTSTFTLNLNIGNPNQDLGTVHIQSDSATGWVLLVRSTQGGTLHHSTHPFAISYSLTVDDIQVSSLADGNNATALTASTLTCPPPTGCTLPVRATVLVGDIAQQPSGSYSDTLVFTLINQ